ncbi:MAG TPA: hypothetical protein VJM33_20215 [Microthrixaceae bacterium]|nr:hypothetical protein [Microthrixaceae bacterium]
MTKPGPLVATDELLSHQIVDTFARVAQSDRSWTEKIWAMAAARDGSLSMAFGLGKYLNRDVMDGFAGISRGTEQWTVRASRRLTPDLERTEVGPIAYEIVESLQRTRYVLAVNDVVPISFDLEVEGVAPPAIEERETHVSRSRLRIDADIMRFHQAGVARGWIDVDGERTELDDESWVGARDRSWGVRYEVGAPMQDIEVTTMPSDTSGMFVWMPVTMTRPDGRSFTLFVYYQHYQGAGWSTGSARGAIELSDGRNKPFRDVIPSLEFRDDNRRLVGGTIRVVMADGSERDYRVDPVSTTGFHLGTGLYGGYEGHHQGEWRGDLVVEGEHIDRCDEPEVARRIHQHRDCIVRVEDLADGSTGVGSMQSGVIGAHPEMGLTAEASFR